MNHDQVLTPGTSILEYVVQRQKDCLEVELHRVSVAVCGPGFFNSPSCIAAAMGGGWMDVGELNTMSTIEA